MPNMYKIKNRNILEPFNDLVSPTERTMPKSVNFYKALSERIILEIETKVLYF